MQYRGAWFAAVVSLLNSAVPTVGSAETIATFTRDPSNPILRGVRIGSEIAAKSLDALVVHFIPRSETPSDQLGLIDEVIRDKPDAIVLAPFDPSAVVPAVDKLSAAGIPVINVNERLSGGNTVAYVGTDDYELALTTARYLINAMDQRGNVVILEGPETLLTSVARLREFPTVKLLASKSANYACVSAAQEMIESFAALSANRRGAGRQ